MPERMRTVKALVKQISAEARTVIAVITTTKRDRQGDIVESKGLDFENFMLNPVVLWAHQYGMLPVGKVIEVNKQTKKVSVTVKFATHTFADEVFGLYKDGTLNAWSLGFIPDEVEALEDAEGKAIPLWEGAHIKSAEVLELSAVTVPANSEALSKRELVLKSLKFDGEKLVPIDDKVMKTIRIDVSAPNMDYSPTAFKRSMEERGFKGKIPMHMEFVAEKSEAGAWLDVEVLRWDAEENTVKEFKVLSAVIKILEPDADTPEPESEVTPDSTEDGNGISTEKPAETIDPAASVAEPEGERRSDSDDGNASTADSAAAASVPVASDPKKDIRDAEMAMGELDLSLIDLSR